MNLKCNGQLEIKCNKCGAINSIDCEDLPFDVVESEERSMGVEKCHSADFAIECSKCGAEISGKYDVWEYPAGVINTDDVEVDGGTLVSKCNCEMEE